MKNSAQDFETAVTEAEATVRKEFPIGTAPPHNALVLAADGDEGILIQLEIRIAHKIPPALYGYESRGMNQ